eukprot:TRINITY_DN7044_c0_g1_i1.p1 TRINITY_DN7044_c0_g1~~TRINITY_DN7044_c0_g1_i1.p1  ORF type:complete len:551 (+),score=122.09 TRINITY_DN7044_c0_g1_i1:47-1699(+)
MSIADFKVTANATCWAVVHVPSGVDILSLPMAIFSKVEMEDSHSGLRVMATRVQEGDVVAMPVRFGSGADSNSMLLDVEVLGTQEIIKLNVNSTDTLSVVKERLSYKCGIPAAEQSLWFGAARLDNDRLTVRQSGLGGGNAWLRVGRCGKIRVTVRVNPFTIVRLMLLPSYSIEYVKEIIAERANIPSERQILLLAGQELPGDVTVRDCGLRNGYELTVANKSGLTKRYPRYQVKVQKIRSPAPHASDLNTSVGDVLASVHSMVDQQAQLQTTVQSLVRSYTDNPVPLASLPGPYDTVAHSKSLRAAAMLQADSALNMSAKTPHGLADMKFGHRHDILHYLAEEAQQAGSEHTTANGLSRMERTRQEYNLLRHDINMENMKKDDKSCKLCGHSKDGDTTAVSKPAPKASASASASASTAASKPVTPNPSAKPATQTATSTAKPSPKAGAASTVSRPSSNIDDKPIKPAQKRAASTTSTVPLDDRPLKPPPKTGSASYDDKPIKPATKPTPKPAKKDKDTASQSSEESVMGDHLLGDPEAVEQWLKDHGKM